MDRRFFSTDTRRTTSLKYFSQTAHRFPAGFAGGKIIHWSLFLGRLRQPETTTDGSQSSTPEKTDPSYLLALQRLLVVVLCLERGMAECFRYFAQTAARIRTLTTLVL